MAEDLLSTNSDSFQNAVCQVRAFKFKESVDLNDVLRLIPCPKYENVALLRNNGALDVLNLRRDFANSGRLLKGTSNVKQCHWSSTRHIHVVDHAGDVKELTVGSHGISVSKHCSLSQLAAIFRQEKLDAPSRVELLGCTSGMDILLVNSSQVVTLQLLQSSCAVVAVFSLPFSLPSDASVPLVQLTRHCLVLLGLENQQLYIFHAATGSLHHVFYLQQLGLDLETVKMWQVSHDLDLLALVLESGCVQVVVFRDCLDSLPGICRSLLPPQADEHDVFVPDVHTCDFGEDSWREKLAWLHQPDLSKPVVPWYEEHNEEHWKIDVSMVTRFKSRQPQESSEKEKFWMTSVACLPEEFLSFDIQDMTVSTDMIAVSLSSRQFQQNSVCLINLSTGQHTEQVFAADHFVVLAREASYPHMLLSPQYVAFLILQSHFQQDDFVNRLMQYGSAGLADSVSLVNKWGHSSLPLTMLEIGIKHRQLDTIALFLRTKEKMFTKATVPPATTPTSPVDTLPWQQPMNPQERFGQMVPALQLLLAAVKKNTAEQVSRQFGLQLLFVTLNYLHSLLKNSLQALELLGQDAEVELERKELRAVAGTLVDYIRQLRPNMALVPGDSSMEGSADPGPEQASALWKDLNIQEAVEAALSGNSVMVLQHRLLSAGHEQEAAISRMNALGLSQVLQHLGKGETSQAEQVLFSLGYDKSEKLWALGLYVSDQHLLHVISDLFRRSLCLSPDKAAIVRFLQELYRHYPCRSFSQALLNKSRETERSNWKENDVLSSCLRVTTLDRSSLCGEIGGQTEEDGEEEGGAGLYACVLLDWLTCWSHETQQRVLLDSLTTQPDFDLKAYPDPLILLKYLLSHGQLGQALKLLDHVLDKRLTEVEAVWSVLETGGCSPYCHRMVCKHLAQKGLVSPRVSGDLSLLFESLCSVGGMLQNPHPLQRSLVHLDAFHRHFLHYCATHHLVQPLWAYLHMHRLDESKFRNVPDICRDAQEWRWLQNFLDFYSIASTCGDSGVMVRVSLSSARLTWQMDGPSMDKLLDGHLLAALATLTFSSTPLQPMNTDAECEAVLGQGVTRGAVEARLRQYPTLHHALFPALATDALQHDINVYQLLVGNARLNPRRLFNWQPTNTLRNSESRAVCPDFSQSELVARFAHTKKIGYTYYLRQGRPTYALCSFLADEFDLGVTNIATKRIQSACGVALWVAVAQFTCTDVVMACVAFVEMLGQDSLLLRALVHVGREILVYKSRRPSKNMGADRKKLEDDIVLHIQLCLKSRRRHGPKLLGLLEKAIADSITNEGLDSTSHEAGMRWFLAVVFCQQLRLPQSTYFLEVCAGANKWLPFLWFSQLHQIPRHQLQGILHHFRNRHLRDHLHYVIDNAETRSVFSREASTEQHKSKVKDARSHLYSKIGVSKEKTDADQNTSDEETETSSLDFSLIHTAGDADLMVREEAAEDDVFGVLFAALCTRCPWKSLLLHATSLRNPLFAELAACQSDASLLACLCGWLVAMATSAQHAKFLESRGQAVCGWGLPELKELITLYLDQDWQFSLATAFHIFAPDCPMLPLLKFVAEATQSRNYAAARMFLGDFKDAISPVQRRTEEASLCGSPFHDRDEIEATAFHILTSMLAGAACQYQALQILQLLDLENIALLFSFDVPDFGKLHKMVAVLHKHSISIRLSVLMEGSSEEKQVELEKTLACLLGKQAFADAKRFADLGGIPPDQVLVNQMAAERKELQATGVWQAGVTRAHFWHQCFTAFQQNSLGIGTVTSFFQDEAERTSLAVEKAMIYEMSQAYVEKHSEGCNVELQEEVYRQHWTWKIQAHIQGQQMAERSGEPMEEIFAAQEWPSLSSTCQASNDLLYCGKMPSKREASANLSKQEVKALDFLIGQMLMEGRLRDSCRLATIFCHDSPDLKIILSCIRLALGTVTVDTLDMEVRLLMTQQQQKRSSLTVGSVSSVSLVSMNRSASVASLGSLVGEEYVLSEEMERTIQTMETLLSQCHQGKQFCARVIATYKVACLLEVTYDDVVGQDEFSILEQILKTKFAVKLILARDFLSSSTLTDTEVVTFLAQTIIKSLKVCLEDSSKLAETETPASSRELIFRPTQGLTVFQQFINLCQNTSLLGDRLLEAMAELALEEQTASVLSIQTELLILAHESHTAACSMEGISHVLRAARILTEQLAAAQQFPLVIRLLTGVGRFSEMTFVFDTIMQHHQFELLMKRGIEKVEGLKVALLDYLKRYHPADKDTFTMVALNFTMYRQIAAMLEARGHQEMEELARKPPENTRDIQDQVKKCIQYFADAADSYVKEKCTRHATTCIQWARLAALQLQLLPNGVQVFRLTPEQVTAFITNNPRIREALVVAEAYGKAPWAAAIHQHVILGGDFHYMMELSTRISVTPVLIQDAISRFQQSGSKSEQGLSNIRKLLVSHCRDIQLQYSIAQDLGLTDVVNNVLRGESGLYLKDIMTSS